MPAVAVLNNRHRAQKLEGRRCSMNERATEYREKLEELRSRGGGRWRTPAGLRDEIRAWALSMREAGHSTVSIAEAIQLSESTLSKWMSRREGGGRLRRVRVEDETRVQELLAVVTPGGFRLEGLNVDQAVNVLRRL